MMGTGKFKKRPCSQLNALDRKQKSSQLSAMHCQTEAHIIACTSPSIMNLGWNMSDSISQGQQNDKNFQVMAHGTRIANDISGHFNTEKIRHCHLRAWFYARQKAIFPFIEGRSKSFARVGMKRRRILQAALAQVSHPCMLKKGKIAYMDERLLATQIIGKKNACQSCLLAHLC